MALRNKPARRPLANISARAKNKNIHRTFRSIFFEMISARRYQQIMPHSPHAPARI
jgi:hypothetical protein